MKIVIWTKRLGSASSLLLLSLLQPTASANTADSNTSNQPSYESSITTSLQQTLSHTQLPPSHPFFQSDFDVHAKINPLTVKQQITYTFTAYYQAAEKLEEAYQDHVDQVLDLYETEIDQARQRGDDVSIAQAKHNADKKLDQLRVVRDNERMALQSRFNIS